MLFFNNLSHRLTYISKNVVVVSSLGGVITLATFSAQISLNVEWGFKDKGNRIANLIEGIFLLVLTVCFVFIVVILQYKLSRRFPLVYLALKCKLFALWVIFGLTIGLRGIYDILYYLYVRKRLVSDSEYIG